MATKISSHNGSNKAYMSFGGRYRQDMLSPGTTAADVNAMPANDRAKARKAHKRAARDAFSGGDRAGYMSQRKIEKSLK